MRKFLSINLLIACFVLPSCADHSGSIVATSDGPDAPINDPDTGVFNPPAPTGGGTGTEPSSNGGSGNGTTGEGGAGSEPTGGGTGGAGNGGGTGNTGGGTGNTGGGGGGGSTVGNEGSGNGQPVPEPGTLLLVGSGLAGVGASLLRRRRKREQTA